jgi:quercetin dioxygenase-like cupin family protein
VNSSRKRNVGLLLIASAGLVTVARSQEKKDAPEAHNIVHFADLKWTPIIKDCSIATVQGDFNVEAAPFVLRFHCTDGAKVPAHWHPTDENMTVLKGTFLIAMGETFEQSKLQPMNPGNYVFIPKEMRHFGLIKGDTIIQVHGIGPFKVNWVNPSDVQPPDASAAARKAKP